MGAPGHGDAKAQALLFLAPGNGSYEGQDGEWESAVFGRSQKHMVSVNVMSMYIYIYICGRSLYGIIVNGCG